MSQQKLLTDVVRILSNAGIEYMLTGSVVSSLQGEPRLTHDIDIVIAIEGSSAHGLAQSFPPPRFYLNEDGIVDAIDHQSMFNLIDTEEGDKVDFWILTDEPFDQSRFSRRHTEHVLGGEIKVSTPEDTILAKLRWANLCRGSEKQFVDALRVFEVQSASLDMEYIERWAKELEVESLWRRLLHEAEEL